MVTTMLTRQFFKVTLVNTRRYTFDTKIQRKQVCSSIRDFLVTEFSLYQMMNSPTKKYTTIVDVSVACVRYQRCKDVTETKFAEQARILINLCSSGVRKRGLEDCL